MNSLRTKLRQHFKHQRQAIDASVRAQATRAINQHLIDYFDQAGYAGTTVAAYRATADEVDLSMWLATYLAAGGDVALPRIQPGNTMTFHSYTAATELAPNRYGIAEPPQTNSTVTETDIDVVLVPLLAFDEAGTRLGMGGGYYDRFLPDLRPDADIIGVAFTCQQSVEPLPKAVWDIPLHTVVTENGVLELAGNTTKNSNH
jgi:5-formyltetrahydrofolate cyclo-ligase